MLLALTPVAYFFNPDVVITPALRLKGFQNITILIISGTIGSVEMFIWYIGWGGIANLIKKWFEDDLNFAKKIAGEMKRDGYLDEIKIRFTKKYKKLDEKTNKLLRGLKMGGCFSFFWIGFWPTPGPRVVGDFFCGTTKRRGAFIALCAGNFLKTAYLIFAWDKVFSFFGH